MGELRQCLEDPSSCFKTANYLKIDACVCLGQIAEEYSDASIGMIEITR